MAPTEQRRLRLRRAVVLLLGTSLVLPLIDRSSVIRALSAEGQGPAEVTTENEDSAWAQAVSEICPRRYDSGIASSTLTIPFCSNRPLDQRAETVKRVVIVVHGRSRNAVGYYDYVRNAARTAGAESTTIIVAPQFLTENDIAQHHLTSDVLFWTEDAWKQGDSSRSTSAHHRSARVSSFSLVDGMLLRLSHRTWFPNLQEIVVTGHSAGAQFVNRFAAGTSYQLSLEQAGIQLKYVIANPSSYLYFNEERRVPRTANQWAIRGGVSYCSRFNDYKYGLRSLNAYMRGTGADQIKAHFASRRVVYLLGENDDNPTDDTLDTSCPAQLQGVHRLERGNVYYTHLGRVFGATIYARHVKEIVPNVAHDGNLLYNSEAGRKYLFDATAPPAPTSVVPAPPSRPTARADGHTISVGWIDRSNNEQGFRIERCTGSNCTNFAIVATVGVNVRGIADRNLAAATTYGYRVRAYNNAGNSPYSATVTATTD